MREGGVVLGFFALAVAMTWPLARRLGTTVIEAKWHYDSMVNLHVLGSRMDYLLGASPGLTSVYDNYFCAPTPYSIANNESHFSLVLLYAPFYLLTGEPLLSYNLLLITCMALSGLCMYLLVRELFGDRLGAFLVGVGYAFCPYVFFELGRIQLVAAHWIPLFALFLHRSLAGEGRLRDMIALAVVFAAQVGSCLYYAMFLLVFAAWVGGGLLITRGKPSRAFLLRLSAAAGVCALLMAPMVYPYVRAREDFVLTRSQALTSAYSGKLEHLLNVYPHNKTLTFLHDAAEGGNEPIAFPGFTLLALGLLALGVPWIKALIAARGRDRMLTSLWAPGAVLLIALSVLVSFVLHTFLAGAALLLVALAVVRRVTIESGRKPLLAQPLVIYVSFLLLGLVLFLGPDPFSFRGEPVAGLYDYLYDHVLGFDGIRYVSRFIVVDMLALSVIAGSGAALALRAAGKLRVGVFAALLAVMLLELRNAPIALAELPSRNTVPAVYAWLAKHPGPEPIATIPAYPYGYFGARNDYFALFHKRRTVDGKSSWMPPITHTFIFESRRFPRSTTTRILRALGAKYLVVHSEEYSASRKRRVLEWLDRRPDDYARRFSSGDQIVYEILPTDDPTVKLLETPAVPKGSVAVPPQELTARASTQQEHAHKAIDAKAKTRWRSLRYQSKQDWFELMLKSPRSVSALELSGLREPFEAPSAFSLSVLDELGQWKAVVMRPEIQLYRDQVFRPRSFAWRVALPRPVRTAGLRIELLDGVARRKWAINEATVWALPR